jgi:hypothetical protein
LGHVLSHHKAGSSVAQPYSPKIGSAQLGNCRLPIDHKGVVSLKSKAAAREGSSLARQNESIARNGTSSKTANSRSELAAMLRDYWFVVIGATNVVRSAGSKRSQLLGTGASFLHSGQAADISRLCNRH